MLTLQKAVGSMTLVVLALGLSACAGKNYNHPAPAAEMATTVLAPIATWNPVAGTENNPGSAASGVLNENNGYFETRQTYEVWNHSGKDLPESIRRRHEQENNPDPRRYYRD